jgi:hypothetical protein
MHGLCGFVIFCTPLCVLYHCMYARYGRTNCRLMWFGILLDLEGTQSSYVLLFGCTLSPSVE